MFNDVHPVILVLGVGIALLVSFFGMRAIRRALAQPRKPGQPVVLPSLVEMVMPMSISDRVHEASRASEIEAEGLLAKQERLLELEARKSKVVEVMNGAGAVVAKN